MDSPSFRSHALSGTNLRFKKTLNSDHKVNLLSAGESDKGQRSRCGGCTRRCWRARSSGSRNISTKERAHCIADIMALLHGPRSTASPPTGRTCVCSRFLQQVRAVLAPLPISVAGGGGGEEEEDWGGKRIKRSPSFRFCGRRRRRRKRRGRRRRRYDKGGGDCDGNASMSQHIQHSTGVSADVRHAFRI